MRSRQGIIQKIHHNNAIDFTISKALKIEPKCEVITLLTKNLGSSMEVIELIPLNIQRDRTKTTLMKSCILGSNGGSSRSKVGPMTEVGSNSIKVSIQKW